MAPPQSYQPASYQAPSHPPQPAQLSQVVQAQGDPLEQRILDLLYPYRDECFEDEDTATAAKERLAHILSGKHLPCTFPSRLTTLNLHVSKLCPRSALI